MRTFPRTREITSMLVADLVHRATNLCRELVADIAAGKISRRTKELEEFFDALEQACDRAMHLMMTAIQIAT